MLYDVDLVNIILRPKPATLICPTNVNTGDEDNH
jgi:hypothetical protein